MHLLEIWSQVNYSNLLHKKGYSWNKTQGWYHEMWKRWTKVIYETKKPYCYTLGNHDSEADLNRQEIVKLDMTNPYSYTQLFPDNMAGASTFVLPVYSSKDPDKVVMNLWFFDSGDYNCMGVKGYGCVEPKMIDWYKRMSQQLEIEQGGKKPAVAFMHIPPVEYLYAYNVFSSFQDDLIALPQCGSESRSMLLFFDEHRNYSSVQAERRRYRALLWT